VPEIVTSTGPEDASAPTDFFTGLKGYLESPKFQKDLNEEGSVARQFVAKLTPLVLIAEALGSRLSSCVKTEDFERLAQSFAEGNKWMMEAPQKLKQALASTGLVPHPEAVRLAELRELTDIFESAGEQAAADYLFTLHEELLASAMFRRDVQERWQKRKRWQVVSEVFAAYDAKLYSLVVPPALAQAEGIVAHLFGLEGMKLATFKEKVAELHEENFDLFGPLTSEVLDGLLGRFAHGTPVAKLNRNAVLHGADSSYGTRENAVAAIVWADYIMCAANDYKAIAVPKSGQEAADIMAGRR
jgi:hypothetical protein